MSFSTTSTLSINGISVTLSVQVSAASFRRQAEEWPTVFSTEEIEGLALKVQQGMPQTLLQAQQSVSRSLLIGASEILQDQISVLAKP
ncbi:MAG: hypothetical protein WCZ86_03845 [Desulfurivibrionaceae bacterium]|jgi:hypothetical protein